MKQGIPTVVPHRVVNGQWKESTPVCINPPHSYVLRESLTHSLELLLPSAVISWLRKLEAEGVEKLQRDELEALYQKAERDVEAAKQVLEEVGAAWQAVCYNDDNPNP